MTTISTPGPSPSIPSAARREASLYAAMSVEDLSLVVLADPSKRREVERRLIGSGRTADVYGLAEALDKAGGETVGAPAGNDRTAVEARIAKIDHARSRLQALRVWHHNVLAHAMRQTSPLSIQNLVTPPEPDDAIEKPPSERVVPLPLEPGRPGGNADAASPVGVETDLSARELPPPRAVLVEEA